MGQGGLKQVRVELATARMQLWPLLEQLRTGGKIGEHLAPDKPLPPASVLELAQRTRVLLECVIKIPHSDLHNTAWLLLLHLRYYMQAAGVPEEAAFEELLWAKNPER